MQGEYLKGEPVSEFEPGKVYVMEFWATWCGPCIAAIPHVTELQAKYGDEGLVVIGQNVWERDAEAARVAPFVEEQGDKMGYRVAHDKDGQMAETWMRAAGQNGIPCSMIVDQEGKLAWIGHPMSMEPVIEKVLAGEFDAQAEAERSARAEKVGQEINAAMQSGDTDKALTLLDEYAELNPAMGDQIMSAKFGMLAEAERYDDAYAVANELIESTEEPMVLNQVAWTIVNPDSPMKDKNLDVALRAAERGVELAKDADGDTQAMILDTLARVHFEQGDVAKAGEVQQQAIDAATNAQLKQQLQESLKEYKSEPM